MTIPPRPTKVSDLYKFIGSQIAKSIETETSAVKYLGMMIEAVKIEKDPTRQHHTLEDLLNLMQSNLEKNIASQTIACETLIQLANESDRIHSTEKNTTTPPTTI